LNERHILTRTGLSRWRRSAVHGIVTNPAYKGLAAYNKTQVRDAKRSNRKTFLKGGYTTKALTGIRVRDKSDWIEIPVPAIVTESIYEQAQHQLAKNKRFSKRNQRRHYLLTGFLRCQECGYAITGYSSSTLSNGSKRLTYKCNGAVNANFPNGKPCTSHPVAAPILEY
jgi:site-specific DNA recombinase